MNAYVNSLPVNADSIGANAWPSPSQPCSTTTAWRPWPTRWCECNARKNREKRSRTSWSGLQDPFAVFDLDHHACPRVEPEVIGLAHVDGAVGDAQFLDALQGVAQRAPELFRARLCHLERLRNRGRELETGVPRVRAEGGHGARSVCRLVHSHVFLRELFRRVIVRQLRRDDHGTRRHESVLDILAADAKEIVVRNAVVEIELPLVTVLAERARRKRGRRTGRA